jgi:hypothetical protein
LGIDLRRGQKVFLLLHSLQNGSRDHLGLRIMATGGSSPRRGPESGVDLPTPPSAEVENAWDYTSIPPIHIPSMVLNEGQDNFTV